LRENKFHVAQRYSRGAAGLAGAQAEPLRVWIDDWTIADGGGDGTWIVHAEEDGVAIDLRLTAEKPPVLNGDAGLSKKSSRPGNASYYYSITRMHTEGEIRTGKSRLVASGLSWLDREWGSSALAPEQIGWDWFALQLSDGSDLMFYNLRQVNGMQDPHSAGTWTDASGNSQRLRNDEVQITVRDYWDSERGGRYPSAWTLEIPARNIRLEVKPVIENQELITTVRYWEGAVDVQGKSGSADITGRGYVELTGYAE
jgi:predicted secreted hydrolase